MALRLSGLASGMDTDAIVQQLMEAQKMKNKKVEDKQTLLTWKQDKWKDLNTKLYKLYTDSLSKMRMQGSYQSKKGTTTDENIATVTAGVEAPEGSHTLTVNKLAKAQFVTGGTITQGGEAAAKVTSASTKLADLGIAEGTVLTIGTAGKLKTLTVKADTTIKSFVDRAKDAGLNASFDSVQGRLFISAKKSGLSNSFQISDSTADGAAALNKLGLDALGIDGLKVNATSTLSTVVEAADSEIIYNNAKITSSSNEVSVNGLKISLKSQDAGKEINLNVTKDTQATYDMVKNFVKSYNEILGEMNKLYYAASSKGYNPLTDEEKEAMTEDQIEKWEAKIQDSILRRDSTMGALLSAMKTTMMGTVEVNEKNYSLASLGIQTSTDYSEKGLLHINGDKDDAVYSAEADKLMKALEEDPDMVTNLLSGVSKKLYDTMYDKMKSIPNVRSALTFYNDKTMIDQQRVYEKQIKKLEDKLIDMEDKYYKQFTAMETAMSKLQSQSNALAGLMGMNNGQ